MRRASHPRPDDLACRRRVRRAEEVLAGTPRPVAGARPVRPDPAGERPEPARGEEVVAEVAAGAHRVCMPCRGVHEAGRHAKPRETARRARLVDLRDEPWLQGVVLGYAAGRARSCRARERERARGYDGRGGEGFPESPAGRCDRHLSVKLGTSTARLEPFRAISCLEIPKNSARPSREARDYTRNRDPFQPRAGG